MIFDGVRGDLTEKVTLSEDLRDLKEQAGYRVHVGTWKKAF